MNPEMNRAAPGAPGAARETAEDKIHFTPIPSGQLQPDRIQAEAFLMALDPNADAFTFQTFDDNKERRAARHAAYAADVAKARESLDGEELNAAITAAKRRHRDPLAAIIEGSLDDVWEQLQTRNENGAGIYVTVNETRLNRTRNASSIVRARAVFADLDGAPLEPVMACSLHPHIVVETSPGRFQALWFVESLPLDQFKAIQQDIAARFDADRNTNDLPRVLRLPGFYHQKGEAFQSHIIELNLSLPRYSAGEITAAFGARRPIVHTKGNFAGPMALGEIIAGSRNKEMLSVAGQLRAKRMTQPDIESRLLAINQTHCKPPLDESEVLDVARRYGINDQSGFVWSTAEPVPNSLRPVQQFDPVAMLPGTFAHWVIDIAERMQCPVDYVGIAVMAACGSIIGARIGVHPKRVDNWYEVPNLWGLVIGRSGDKKTPAIQDALAPLRNLQAGASGIYQNALGSYQLEKLQHEQSLHMKKKLAANGTHILSIGDLQPPPPPEERRYLVNDTTVEALGVILQKNPNGVLCYADELVGLLARLEGEERRSDRAFYLEAYNGKGSFSVDRITRDRVYIPRLCVSILGTSQPDALKQYLRGAILGGVGNDGLVQRFQLAIYPDRDPGPIKMVDRAPDGIVFAQAMQAFRDLDMLDPSAIGASSRCSIPTIGFDDEAQPVVNQWLLDMENVLRDSNAHPALISYYSKLRKTIPTLALIIHLAEYGVGAITLGTFLKALAWVSYLRSHAQRIYASVTSGYMDAARALANRIDKGKVQDGFTTREIVRNEWSGLSLPDDVRQAVDFLVDLGWLQQTTEQTGGRPKTRYWIHPDKRPTV